MYAINTAARLVKKLITPKVTAADRSGDTRDVSAVVEDKPIGLGTKY
jgi:hypothetical protein